jgi:hypothetical protein
VWPVRFPLSFYLWGLKNSKEQPNMALLEKQLYLKKSILPISQKGLFTKKFIPAGERIVEYKGVIRKWKDVEQDEDMNVYLMYVNRNHVIDAKPMVKTLGRFANDAKGLIKVPGLKNNAEYITEGKKVYIEATRDIEAGSEILVNYGKDYWKVVRAYLKKQDKAGKAK